MGSGRPRRKGERRQMRMRRVRSSQAACGLLLVRLWISDAFMRNNDGNFKFGALI
jgi:hypothetical protein